MKTAKDLLREKSPDIWTIAPDASVFDAIELIAEKNIGALLVMADDRVIGLISERDYARKVVLAGHNSREIQVREVMTEPVVGVRPDQSLEDCMGLMTDKRVRHLPVMQGDELVGVLSIGDLVRSIIAEQQSIIDQLEHYISG